MQLKIQTPPWLEDFLQPARYKGAYGGRGSGKSHAFAELLIEQMLLNPNAKWVCIREVQKSLNQSVKALLEHKIEAMGASHYFEVQQAMVKNKHGNGIIIFQGMQNHTADSIKSLEGYDGAWVEEAQSLSQRSLDLLRPTIRKEGSELWFTWNPRYEKDPIDLFLRGGDPPSGSVIKRVNWSDNPWFPDVLRDEMEYDRRRDPEKFAHVWEGEYESLSEARVFKNWKVDEFESPKDAMFKFGADWGFAKDPTVLVRGWFEGRTLYIDYEAYEVGCEIDKTPDLFLTIPESEVFTIVADSARPETISYMQKHGFPNIRKALKGKNSIIEGINFLKSFDIIVHPRCTHVIDELTLYSYKVDPLTEEVMPILKDEHNHTIDSLRYLAESSRRAHKAIKALDVRPIPSINKWNGRRHR
jgi:phage terminase large subunit